MPDLAAQTAYWILGISCLLFAIVNLISDVQSANWLLLIETTGFEVILVVVLLLGYRWAKNRGSED